MKIDFLKKLIVSVLLIFLCSCSHNLAVRCQDENSVFWKVSENEYHLQLRLELRPYTVEERENIALEKIEKNFRRFDIESAFTLQEYPEKLFNRWLYIVELKVE